MAVIKAPCPSYVVDNDRRWYCSQGDAGHDGTCIGDKDQATYDAEVRAATRARLDHAGNASDEPHPGEDWTP